MRLTSVAKTPAKCFLSNGSFALAQYVETPVYYAARHVCFWYSAHEDRGSVSDQVEKIRSCLAHEGNLRMWGQLYVSRTDGTVAGWLVDSWSENGAPYWNPKMHWLDRRENNLYNVYLDIGFGQSSMNLRGEDIDIDEERAKFILATVDKWEQEWLAEEGKKF
jgi:hypothetical protein